MAHTRRGFLACFGGLVVAAFSGRASALAAALVQGSPDELKSRLLGTWRLESYTYTSNNKTYEVPHDMEATAQFTSDRYDTQWSTYIWFLGYKRTRKASEKGTYSISGDRIRLVGEEASQDNEKGEEFLTDVRLDGDTLRLTSNNGANLEVWKKVA